MCSKICLYILINNYNDLKEDYILTPEQEQRHHELEINIAKLSNGGRGDPLIMSDALVDIAKTLQILIQGNYTTRHDCAYHKKDLEDMVKTKCQEKTAMTWKSILAVIIGCSTVFGLGMALIHAIFGTVPTM